MGGEKAKTAVQTGLAMGSPPHGRGKAVWPVHTAKRVGITPAWAGKSGWRASKNPPGRDHPRMGGEKTKKIP